MKSLDIKMTGVMYICEGCALAKAKAKSVPKMTMSKATQPGERLCKDISGPYKKSILGNDYWILVVDDYIGKSWSFFVKKKSFAGLIGMAKQVQSQFEGGFQCGRGHRSGCYSN